jgi:hypothetical protein
MIQKFHLKIEIIIWRWRKKHLEAGQERINNQVEGLDYTDTPIKAIKKKEIKNQILIIVLSPIAWQRLSKFIDSMENDFCQNRIWNYQGINLKHFAIQMWKGEAKMKKKIYGPPNDENSYNSNQFQAPKWRTWTNVTLYH